MRMPYFRAHWMALRKYLSWGDSVPERGTRKKDALPTRLREEGLAVPDFDGPIGERNAHPIKPGASDRSEILLGL